MNITNYKRLDENGINGYMLERIETKDRTEKINPGIYTLDFIGDLMVRYPVLRDFKFGDNLIHFEESVINKISSDISHFFSKEIEEGYKKMGVVHKMATIIYGKHGTGKTSAALLAMKKCIKENDCIAINATNYNSPSVICHILQRIRQAQDNKILVFIDEIEKTILNNEYEWLSFLDGTDSVDGVAIIGCTNFLKKIPERIRDRKSRVKKCYPVNKLPDAVYRQFISEKCPFLGKEKISEIIYKISEKGLVIDQLKNVLIDYCVFNMNIEDAIKNAEAVDITQDYKDREPDFD